MTGESVVPQKRLLQLMKKIGQTDDYHRLTPKVEAAICVELKLDPTKHRFMLQYPNTPKEGKSPWPVLIALEAKTTVLAPSIKP